MSDMTQSGREARKWLASASRASGDSLNQAEAGTVDALIGIGNALLDLTAAVREQTAATRPGSAASLTASDSAKCTEIVGDEEDEDGLHECGKLSRYVVERSDGDTSFGSGGGTEEACEEHLSGVVVGMVDGDERIRAVVSIRWTG